MSKTRKRRQLTNKNKRLLKTETLTIPSNYLKIVFRTDGSGNNYYGFKALITPNYD